MPWRGQQSRGLLIGKCESCQTETMMVKHVRTKKLAPIEVQPSEDGNISVTGTTYEIVPVEMRQLYKDRGYVLRKNHMANCTHARLFAKQKPKTLGNVVRGKFSDSR